MFKKTRLARYPFGAILQNIPDEIAGQKDNCIPPKPLLCYNAGIMSFAKPALVPKHIIYGFFLLGLVSSVAFRAIILFQHLEPSWVRPAWYTGVLGYLFFFLYRYRISKKRKKAIDDFELIKKIRSGATLTGEDREVLAYLLLSIKSSLEDVNYATIFLFSIMAILADIALTLLT